MFENWDLAQVVLYLFWIFFAGLLLYLRREDRREGYPLESDTMPGRLLKKSIIFFPEPKTFALPHGGGLRVVPDGRADTRPIAARPMARWPGAPLVPDEAVPLLAGVGPGAYAERSDTVDMTVENHAKIVPLRVAPAYWPMTDGPDPRGYTVVGLDRAVAGTVVDLWIDRSELVLRYLEVEIAEGAASTTGQSTAGSATRIGQGFEAKPAPVPSPTSEMRAGASVEPLAEARGTGRTVLLPVNFANIRPRHRRVSVKALLGRQIAMAPQPASPDQITFLEEEKIMGFYGAGFLYATTRRAEPLL